MLWKYWNSPGDHRKTDMKKINTTLPMSRFCFRVFVLFLGFAFQSAFAQEEPEYVRFIQGGEEWQGELQTAVVTFENSEGVELDLVAAVHLGEQEYYAQLNEYFTTRDVVLYELIAEPNQIPVRDGARSSSLIGFIQQAMADFLQVGFQLNEIDYSPFNFLHADLTPSQLQALMASKNESFLTMFLDLAMAQIGEQSTAGDAPLSSLNMLAVLRAMNAEDSSAAFKYLFAAELGRSGGVMVGAELEQEFTILGDRNAAALRVLGEAIQNPDNQRISIFFGAAHMPGIERAVIADLGFTRIAQRWLPAWTVP